MMYLCSMENIIKRFLLVVFMLMFIMCAGTVVVPLFYWVFTGKNYFELAKDIVDLDE